MLRSIVSAYATAHAYGGERRNIYVVGENVLLGIYGAHSFGDSGLEDVVAALGSMNGQQANARADAGFGRQNGCAHLAEGAANEQSMSIDAFVGEVVAGFE